MPDMEGLATRAARAVLCSCLLCPWVACASGPAAPSDVAEPIRALGIQAVAYPAPGLLTGGQLTESQIAALAEQGYRSFVCLRPRDEKGTGWEEAYAAEHGLSFTRIPIGAVEDLSTPNAERLAAVLPAGDGSPPVVLYCRSSNRVGALLALKCRQVDGRDPGECLDLGLAAGMTSLEPAVRRLLGLENGASSR